MRNIAGYHVRRLHFEPLEPAVDREDSIAGGRRSNALDRKATVRELLGAKRGARGQDRPKPPFHARLANNKLHARVSSGREKGKDDEEDQVLHGGGNRVWLWGGGAAAVEVGVWLWLLWWPEKPGWLRLNTVGNRQRHTSGRWAWRSERAVAVNLPAGAALVRAAAQFDCRPHIGASTG